MTVDLDIIIPVYNEGSNILATIGALAREVKTPARVLICYDFPEDNTLPVVGAKRQDFPALPIEFVRNPGRGVHAAVIAGFTASNAPFVLVFPADDDFNAGMPESLAAVDEIFASHPRRL